MSGQRDVAPPAVPEELQNVDALTRVRGMKRIIACADPYAFPYTEITDVARGFDIDLLKAVAESEGWEAQFVWVVTEGRGGLNRAFRTSIRKGVCDVFLGLGTGGSDDILKKSKLTLMAPTFGVHYVFATFDPKLQAGSLEALAAAKVVLVPSTSLAEARRSHPDKPLRTLVTIEPQDAVEWSNTWATQAKESELRAFLEQRIGELRAQGRLQEILASYGIPYFPPVAAK
jgi:ABC-type amino acid transport substrate-binding protein